METSVIVRFRNEERYIGAVLGAVKEQVFSDYEVLAVDNCSTDGSRRIAAYYADRMLTIENYQPGKALNRAIEQARGDRIAVVSAHAIPANAQWLRTLHSHLDDGEAAGVYGGQLYPIHSRFLDKRDLDIFSSLEPRVERVDSDFWNANSMFPRSVWETQKFEESVFELEDHHWTKLVLPRGYEIHFEPAALVYHYGHIQRLDREHLPPSDLAEVERIDQAVAVLEDNEADWPAVMNAGLTLSSLTQSKQIGRAVHALGRRLLTHWDFDVRWRMAQALGKIQNESSVQYLIGALFDRSFYPRDEAAWALARLGRLAIEPLLRLTGYDGDTASFVALALGGSGDRRADAEAVRLLAGELRSGEARRQRDAAYCAGEVVQVGGCEALVPELQSAMRGIHADLTAVCCWALGRLAQRAYQDIDWEAIRALAERSPHPQVRFEATVAIGKLALAAGEREAVSCAVEWLQRRLASREPRIRYGAMQSLRLLAEAGRLAAMPDFEGGCDDDFGVRYEWTLLLENLFAAEPCDSVRKERRRA
jgi:HEAT repeat protein